MMLPHQMHTTTHCFPYRTIYKLYGEEGDTLREFAKGCKNKREKAQAKAAADDIEKLAREVIRYAQK